MAAIKINPETLEQDGIITMPGTNIFPNPVYGAHGYLVLDGTFQVLPVCSILDVMLRQCLCGFSPTVPKHAVSLIKDVKQISKTHPMF